MGTVNSLLQTAWLSELGEVQSLQEIHSLQNEGWTRIEWKCLVNNLGKSMHIKPEQVVHTHGCVVGMDFEENIYCFQLPNLWVHLICQKYWANHGLFFIYYVFTSSYEFGRKLFWTQ